MAGDDPVTLLIAEQGFVCSRRSLSAASDYFTAMFSENFSEGRKDSITLKDVDPHCFSMLLKLIEQPHQGYSSDYLVPLLQTAAMLQFTKIQKMLQNQLLASLSCDNCLSIMNVCKSLGLEADAATARTFTIWKFSQVVHTEHYLSLSLPELKEYLCDAGLHGSGKDGEWEIYEAIVKWLEHDEIERSVHIVDLLECLNYHHFTSDDINNLLFYSNVSDNDDAVQFLQLILEEIFNKIKDKCTSVNSLQQEVPDQLQTDSTTTTTTTHSIQMRQRIKKVLTKSKRKSPLIPCVVGFRESNILDNYKKKKAKCSDDDEEEEEDNNVEDLAIVIDKYKAAYVPVVYYFNTRTKELEELVHLKLNQAPVACSGFQVCNVGPCLYMMGGEFLLGYSNWNTSVWCYNTITQVWTVKQSIPRVRRHFYVCVHGSVIYLIGGLGKHRCPLDIVDAYHTDVDDWFVCKNVPYDGTMNGAICSYKNHILMFTYQCILRYYPSSNLWTTTTITTCPHSAGFKAAVVHNDIIYLIGISSTKVFRYNPNEGETINYFGQFYFCPINICVIDGMLYSFTHEDDIDDHVVEMMDLEGPPFNGKHGNIKVDLEGPALNTTEQDTSNTKQGNINLDLEGLPLNTTEQDTSKDKQGNINGDSIHCSAAEVIQTEDGSSSNSTIEPNDDNSKGLHSIIIHREDHNGPHVFTTMYPTEFSHCLGCFPLLKCS